MKHIHTTLGPRRRDELGIILPHEHVFVDLRTPDKPGYAEADVDDVVALMVPQIEAIKRQGVTLLVECTTGGVGRRADIDLAVSKAADFPIVVPTGNYREPWIPAWIAGATENELEHWMVGELTDGIEDTGVVAGREARRIHAHAVAHALDDLRRGHVTIHLAGAFVLQTVDGGEHRVGRVGDEAVDHRVVAEGE